MPVDLPTDIEEGFDFEYIIQVKTDTEDGLWGASGSFTITSTDLSSYGADATVPLRIRVDAPKGNITRFLPRRRSSQQTGSRS